jgi:hypothetical protein
MINQKKISLILCLLLLSALALASPVSAAGSHKEAADELIIGNTFILSEGETYTGDLFVVGGTVSLEVNSSLNGNIFLLGATLVVDGTVNGDIISLGGNVGINRGGVVEGDINSAGTSLDIDPSARVEGDVNTETSGSFYWDLPQGIRIPSLNVRFNPFLEMLWFAFRTLLWALLAMLIVMFLVKPADRVARAVVSEPLVSGGVGLLTTIVAPIVLVVLSLTIILIPVTFTVFIALVIAWGFGLVAIGLELGRRISKIFNQEWHPALAAGAGTFVLIFVVNGLDALVSCVGWIPKFIVGVFGLGGVLITFLGTRDYPVAQGTPSTPQIQGNEGQTHLVEDTSQSENEPQSTPEIEAESGENTSE